MRTKGLILGLCLLNFLLWSDISDLKSKNVRGEMENVKEKKLGGIVWFQTKQLEKIVNFYTRVIGCKIWLEQKEGKCTICKHGNLLIGFCQRETVDLQGLPCFFYQSRKEVDHMYEKLRDVALSPPGYNKIYRVYNFFAKDPDGRRIEFQTFEHKLPSF